MEFFVKSIMLGLGKDWRALQVKVVEESKRCTQRELAERYNIPRTTLQHWIKRKE